MEAIEILENERANQAKGHSPGGFRVSGLRFSNEIDGISSARRTAHRAMLPIIC
jgi:hypothetical protein